MKYERVARRFSDILARNNMTAKELAEQSGVSESSISQYMNGNHKPSNISSGKIARVFGINPLWLMGYDVSMDQNQSVISDEASIAEALMAADALKYKDILLNAGFILNQMNEFGDQYILMPTTIEGPLGSALTLDINGVQEFNQNLEKSIEAFTIEFMQEKFSSVYKMRSSRS